VRHGDEHVHQPKLGTDGNRVASGLNWSRKCATPHGHLARANSSPGSDARDGRRTWLGVANRRPWWAMTTPAPCSAGVRRREYGAEAVRRVCRRERAVTERDVGTSGDRGGVLSSTGEDVVGLRGRRTSGELGGGLLTSTCWRAWRRVGDVHVWRAWRRVGDLLRQPELGRAGRKPRRGRSSCRVGVALRLEGASGLGGAVDRGAVRHVGGRVLVVAVSTIQRSRQCTVECTRRTMSPVKNEY
jgi:hypothetical protein